jgi:ATP-dependent Clp protease protease subunit
MKGRKRNVDASTRSDSDDDIELDSSSSSSDDERIIYFSGDVSETSVSQAIAALFGMARKDTSKPIYIVIETYGGSVDSMFALYDAIKYVPCPVHTIALGKVMSAGVLILAAGAKGERMIAPHARVMTHLGWNVVSGNIFEIKHELSEMERHERQWEDAMSRETGMPVTKIRNELNFRHVDRYLTPQECIAWGIADKMLYELPVAMSTAQPVKTKKPKIRSQTRRR